MCATTARGALRGVPAERGAGEIAAVEPVETKAIEPQGKGFSPQKNRGVFATSAKREVSSGLFPSRKKNNFNRTAFFYSHLSNLTQKCSLNGFFFTIEIFGFKIKGMKKE